MKPETLSVISLVISILALSTTLITWWYTHRKQKYDFVDSILTDLLKISLDNPEFRDPNHIATAMVHSDLKVRYKYDAYATLVWNYLETLYDTYGEGLVKTPFYGSMVDLGNRHKKWFFEEDRHHDYNSALPKFLKVTS